MSRAVTVAGVDLGSATGKAVILEDERILASAVVRSTMKPERTGLLALEGALKEAGLASLADLEYILGTGYGRRGATFINDNMSEISCHARAAHWWQPEARTVVDVGGQDCKVISLDDDGGVGTFVMNDKCAAGTGRFFEVMARTFDCSLDEFAELSLQSDTPANITKQCSVFAESEVITLINEGVDQADIAAGLTDSIARRLVAMIHKVGLVPRLVISGGCAKNEALIRALERVLGEESLRLPTPQLAGALGAALFARDRALGAGAPGRPPDQARAADTPDDSQQPPR